MLLLLLLLNTCTVCIFYTLLMIISSPSSFLSPLLSWFDDQTMSKTQRHQQEALWEFVHTELTYINKLIIIKDVKCHSLPAAAAAVSFKYSIYIYRYMSEMKRDFPQDV